MALVYDKKLVEGFDYILESEKQEKKPFTVTVTPIDSVTLVELEDGLLQRDEENSLSFRTGSFNVSLCRRSITSWKNLTGEDGKEIKMEKDEFGFISRDSLKMLPPAVINEIAGVISACSQDPKNIQLFSAGDE